jgi:hypothetical protein
MADFCTTMTVVPIGGNDTPPLLGWGPAELWGVALAVEPALVAVDTADAADAGALDPPVATGLEAAPAAGVDGDDPPHAASSSAKDPSPVAAAHPLLRINLSFARMTRSQALAGRSQVLRALFGRRADRRRTLEPFEKLSPA